jgi:two-component system nitrogen regulation response regulator NtrX
MAPGGEGTAVEANMIQTELLRSTPSTLRTDLAHEIMSLPLREAREIFERQYLEAQVARFGNNISKTALFIGMERSALHRKLKLLGVSGLDKN